jgi:nicotinamidase-related amidase
MYKTGYRSPLLLSAADTVFLIVDVQDKLLCLIRGHELLLWNLQRLVAGAQALEIPCRITEQNPEKLGPTTAVLRQRLQPTDGTARAVPAKMSFSGVGCDALMEQLQALERRQVLLAGLETHVCILQTALDLLAAGFEVYLAVDAVGARHELDHQTALRRMEIAGVTPITVESALFEWCECAGTDQFRQLSQIVRWPRPGA